MSESSPPESSGPGPSETGGEGEPLTESPDSDLGIHDGSGSQSRLIEDETEDSGEVDVLGGAVPPDTEEPDETLPRDEPTEPEPSQRPESKIRQQLGRWGPYQRWLCHRSVPVDYHIEHWRERDPEENAKSRLPETEHLDVPAVWVTELYTPSTVPGLLRGIEELGWEHGRTSDESLAKWMSDVRDGRRAGWKGLGLVSPSNDKHFLRERTADLPEGVRGALPVVMSLTPSLTALVVGFLLDDTSARSIEDPLRATYETYSERDPLYRWHHLIPHVLWGTSIRSGIRFHTPDLQRRQAAEQHLDGLEDKCARWVEGNLPGVFASGLRDGLYPTAMLFLTEEVKPLDDEARRFRAFDGTGLDRGYDAWETAEWESCRMALPQSWRKERLRMTFACRRSGAFLESPGYPDPDSNWTIAQRADDLVQGLNARWALSCLLDGYHHHLSKHRDSSAGISSYRPVRDVKELRSLVRTDIYDILTAGMEVDSLVSDEQAYNRNVMEMKYCRLIGGEEIELLQEMRSGQTHRAEQVKQEAELLLSTLSVSADMTQTVSSLRSQRLAMLVAVLSLVVAVVAIVIAVNTTSP